MKETEIYRNVLFLGEININNQYNFPTTAGATGQVLTYDGLGNAVWTSAGALSLTTSDVPEGTNLYFTQERAEDVVGNLIQNGIGLNWTYDDVANSMVGNVNLTSFTTDDLAEGATALYFTEERVDDRVSNLMIGGTGIDFVYNDSLNILTTSIDFGDFTTDDIVEGVTNRYFTNELVDDRVAVLIKNGTGISWFYNDGVGSLTPTVTLTPFTTDNLAEGTSALYFTDERVDDRVSNLIIDSPTVTWTYNDFANTLSANASAIVDIQEAGAIQSSKATLNFIEGPGASISVVDDGVNNRANITIGISNLNDTIYKESIGSLSTVRKSIGSTAFGPYNMVLGGQNNSSSGAYHSIIIGGTGNQTSIPPFGTIINGNNNTNSGYFATIINGKDNTISSSSWATLLGGAYNFIGGTGSANFSTVSGYQNSVQSDFTIVIGDYNTTESTHGVIFGSYNEIKQGGSHNYVKGTGHSVYGSYSTILGGQGSTASQPYTTIINGDGNVANGNYAIVSGFNNNVDLSNYAIILNGSYNTVEGEFNTVINGQNNIIGATAWYSSIIGYGNIADAYGTHIIGSDNRTAGFTGANIIGVGITANSENTTFVNNFNIVDNPISNNSNDNILVRNFATGQLELRDATTIGIYQQSIGANSVIRIDVGATATGSYNMSLGGENNIASGAFHSIVIGGTGNSTSNAPYNTIVNGLRNTNSGYVSTVLNGRDNDITNGSWNTILNGFSNTTANNTAFATIFGNGNDSSGGNYQLIIGSLNNVINGSHIYVNGSSNIIREDIIAPGYIHVSGSSNMIDLDPDYSTITTSAGCTADADFTFIASAANSDTAGFSGVKILGSNIVATAADTTYVENFNIATPPATTSTEDAVLVRNSSTGQIETRDAGTLSGVSVLEGSGETVSSGTGVETSLRTITIPANTLRTDGSAITVQLGGGFGSDSGSQDFRIKFNGNQVYAKNFTGRTTILEFDAKLVITRWNSGFIKAYTTMNMNGETTEVVSYIEFSLDLVNNAYTIDITGESVAASQITIFSSLTTAMVV